MDPERLDELLEEAFYRYSNQEIARVKHESRSFVHYTSTNAALSIINHQEIWLRNASIMNDYSEMAHGEACVQFCLVQNDEVVSRSRKILDQIQEGLHDRLIKWFFETSQMRRNFTYLLSISEHGPVHVAPGIVDEESLYGRLSMWRAYGSSGGVALIFNQDALMRPTDVLPVYSSPVFYGNPDAFAFEYVSMLTFFERNLAEIKLIDPEIIWTNLHRSIHFACLASKHPGFKEEREWRVTYSADPVNEHLSDEEFNSTSTIKREFRVINSVPQRIYKIPFINIPDEGIVGMSLPEILKQVVIGPTQHPMVLFDALYVALERCGFTKDTIRVTTSQIPLRT